MGGELGRLVVSRASLALVALRLEHPAKLLSLELEGDTSNCENNPWIGNEVIVKVDRQHHRPRLRFDHVVWSSLLPPGGGHVPPPPPPASGWDINAPAFMAGPP